MTTVGKYFTYDSSFLSEEILALAMTVNPMFTKTFELFGEMPDGDTEKIKWYDGVPYSTIGAVGTGGWDGSATTALPVSATTASLLGVGDQLRIGTEHCVVKLVNRSGLTIDVYERGMGATSAGTHNQGDVIYVVGNNQVEGSNDVESLMIDSLERVNYYSLVEEVAEVTLRGMNQKYLDVADKMTDMKRQALERAFKKMNLSLLFGVANVGTKTTPSSLGGLNEFITTYGLNYNASGAISETVLNNASAMAQDKGGTPNIFLCSPAVKRAINVLLASKLFVSRNENTFGTKMDMYESDNGPIAIVADPMLSAGHQVGFMLNTENIKKKWFTQDTMRFVPETNVNSRIVKETLQGSYSLMVKGLASDHVRIYGITNS